MTASRAAAVRWVVPALLAGACALAPRAAEAQGAPQAAEPPAKAVEPTTSRAAGPATAETTDGPVVRHPPSSARWKVLLLGLGVTGVAYGGAALMGGLWEDIPSGEMLYIPVAGPWIAIADSGCAPDEETNPGDGDCEALIGVRAAIYVVGGLLQLGGLGIVATSIAMTTESSETPQVKKATVLPIPMVTPTSVGFGVIGTF